MIEETSPRRTVPGIANPLKMGNRRISNVPEILMEPQIKESLAALLAGIKAADGQTIAEEMVRLDDFVARGRAGLHPQLVHFLENRSYAKALMFLGGDTDIAVGACGGKAPRKP